MESDRGDTGRPGGTRVQRALAILVCVLATTFVTVGAELLTRDTAPTGLAAILAFYLVTAGAITTFAVWNAGELGLPSFLVFEPLEATSRWRRLAIYGIGVGILLSIGSVLFAGGGDAALRPWFWRRIQSQTGIVLFSARAALLEETFFRLFLIPALVAVAERTRRPRYRLRLRDGALRATVREPEGPRPWAIAAAVVVSSLLFGLAHPFNPVPAMLLATLLALSYLRGGWESAVLAHFTADWLVFSFYF